MTRILAVIALAVGLNHVEVGNCSARHSPRLTPRPVGQLLGMTLFEFQKRWNKIVRDFNTEGFEWMYIIKFEMQDAPDMYAAKAILTYGAGYDIVISATVDKESNQVRILGIVSVWPDQAVDRSWVAVSCAILLRSVFRQYSQKGAVRYVTDLLLKAVNTRDNRAGAKIKGIPVTITFTNDLLVFGIGNP